MLPNNAFNFFNLAILEETEPLLVGTQVVAKAPEVPPGIKRVTRYELKKLRSKAKRGHTGDPVPKEVGRLQAKTTYVIEHIHGFDIPEQDMMAAANNPNNAEIIKLPDASARASARLVAEMIEDTIFNGIPEVGAYGIYTGAGANGGNPYSVANGSEWNRSGATPFDDIVNIAELLEANSRYHAKFAVMSAKAIRMFSHRNALGTTSFAQMLEEASDKNFFPNGMDDFYIGPMPAEKYSDDAETILNPPILGSNTVGLVGDFGDKIAQRYVQQPVLGTAVNDVNPGDDGTPSGDIVLREYLPGRDKVYPYNVETYQGIDLHFSDAYIKIANTITS